MSYNSSEPAAEPEAALDQPTSGLDAPEADDPDGQQGDARVDYKGY